ncbi:MAG: DUF1349 domain-containing protein, partial [Akkermansiaceae bacterium]|nr:DUF1349 domain-containing protein [Akkermansiaceae bacterium]
MAGGRMLAAPLLCGQGEVTREATAELARPVVTAVLEMRGGRKAEGKPAFRDDALVITPVDGPAVSADLDEIRSLKVSVRAGEKKGETQLAPSGALPAPWRSKDLGRLSIPGKARWKDGQFVVFVSPRAQGERFDAFHLVYLPMKGDGEIVARVVKVDSRDEDSYGGIMMCDGLTPENRKAVLGVHPFGEKGVNFRRWGYQGGSATGQEIPSLQLPYWVKLVREDYDVSAYYSPDGRRWRFLKTSPGRMRDEEIYVGLAARVHKPERLSEVVIDQVSV